MSYKPLPDNLTIKKSEISGLGLFAVNTISSGFELGITHVKNWDFMDGYIRTPLGGFFNHSNNPNCDAYIDGGFIKMRTVVKIKAGTELTVKYCLYDRIF